MHRLIMRGGENVFPANVRCMGDRQKGYADILPQAQYHRFGIFFPLFMFLAFAIGKNAPPGTLIPGLISITLLFSASSIEPVSIPIERRVKTFDRLLSAPISLYSLVSGESLSGFLYSLGIACLPLAIGVIMFSTPIVNAPVLVIAMISTAFCFATLGTLFAAYPTENVGEVMSMLNTVRLPLIFISGVFIPISAMPNIGQEIALISPLPTEMI